MEWSRGSLCGGPAQAPDGRVDMVDANDVAAAGGGGAPVLRRPVVADGPGVWHMVRGSSLDTNSPYAYFMMFRYFPDTCVVAEHGGHVVGFMTGFRPPAAPDTLFVWQIGVAPAARGQGLAGALLDEVLGRPEQAQVRWLEATVAHSNAASLKLFHGLAGRLGAAVTESPCFPEQLFPSDVHEAEMLLRIGPFAPAEAPAS